MGITPTATTLKITDTTSLQDLQTFADNLGEDVSRLRGTKNDDGSVTLHAGKERANFSDRITGRAKEQSSTAREAIRSVIDRQFPGDSPVKSSMFERMEGTDKGRSLSAEPLKNMLSFANRFEAGSVLAPMLGTIGTETAAQIMKSPTLMARLETLDQNGWTVKLPDETGNDDAGWCDAGAKEIVIGGNLARNPAGFLQTLAHEAGHATNGVAEDTSTRDKYIASQLKDEGGANYLNIKVQREIIADGGIDIGICGACGPDYEKVYDAEVEGKDPGDVDLDDVFTQIGAFFGSGEQASVAIPGTNGLVDYNTYYGHSYDTYILPNKPTI